MAKYDNIIVLTGIPLTSRTNERGDNFMLVTGYYTNKRTAMFIMDAIFDQDNTKAIEADIDTLHHIQQQYIKTTGQP